MNENRTSSEVENSDEEEHLSSKNLAASSNKKTSGPNNLVNKLKIGL